MFDIPSLAVLSLCLLIMSLRLICRTGAATGGGGGGGGAAPPDPGGGGGGGGKPWLRPEGRAGEKGGGGAKGGRDIVEERDSDTSATVGNECG